MPSDADFVWPDGWEAALPAVTRAVHHVSDRYQVQPADEDELEAEVMYLFWLQTDIFARTGRPTFSSVAGVYGWASTTATRLVIKRWNRRQQRAEVGGEGIGSLAGSVEEADFELDLEAIPDTRAREAVRLHVVEGFTFKEIAERLGVAVGTAYNLFRAGALHLFPKGSNERNDR